MGDPPTRRLAGKIDRIGGSGTNPTVTDPASGSPIPLPEASGDHHAATDFLLDWLEAQPPFASINAVGHRVVHGMDHSVPEPVTPVPLEELRRITPHDPEHLPREMALIEAIQKRHPKPPRIACFTRRSNTTCRLSPSCCRSRAAIQAKGIRSYGFHGLSDASLMEGLGRLDPVADKGRVVLAQLGNGASMGLTPASGLVMSSRAGDLDPGLFVFLARNEEMAATQFDRMANHESGLLGVSETSSDMRDLLASETQDVRVAAAVALFCYQAEKWIGGYAAALGLPRARVVVRPSPGRSR